MQGELDPNTLSDRTLLLLMYQEAKHTRIELTEVKDKVSAWKCPGQQCKDHEKRMDDQDVEIECVSDCVSTLKDHEKIVVGAIVIIVSVFGVYVAGKLLGG